MTNIFVCASGDSPRMPRLRSRNMAAAAAAALLLLGACDTQKLLEVTDPDKATPGSLESKQALEVVRAGAIGDFAVGYHGSSGSEGQVTYSGLLADEFTLAETFPTRQEIDQRSMQSDNSNLGGSFRDVQRGRASASFAAGQYASLDPSNPARAEMLNLAGFSAILLGENWCSGVPFSELTSIGGTVFGPPQTTEQIFTAAVAKFDSALTIATAAGAAGTAHVNTAKIGKGRALLNLGQFAAAASAVAGVPTTFNYFIFASANTGRQNNGTYDWQYLSRRWTISDKEGTNGLPYRSDNDPRTPWVRGTGGLAVGFDASTPLNLQLKYPDRSSATPLAQGIEARLIEAEAALKAGNTAGFLAGLNAARPASQAALTAADVPGTANGQVDLLFKERAYDLWLTSHRLGDMRRLIRQYSRPANSVFPSGEYFKGGQFGPDVNLLIPLDEKNNPNFNECLDRNA
jgi:hypothetical protein